MLFIEKLAQSQSVEAPTTAISLAPLQAYVIKNISEDISLDDLAATVGISKFALTRLFHKYYGIAPMRWLWSFRAHLARDIISKGLGLALMDVLTLCGFNSPQHFSRFFRKTFRQAPSSLVKSMVTIEDSAEIAKAKQELYE
ncbi:MAG: AraC family transcriptional regulator, partial [Proteobacteria bacterium]